MSYWQSKHVMRREARKREEGPLSQIDEGTPGFLLFQSIDDVHNFGT